MIWIPDCPKHFTSINRISFFDMRIDSNLSYFICMLIIYIILFGVGGASFSELNDDSILLTNQSDPLVWYEIGEAFLNAGKNNDSIEAFNKAIELNLSYSAAWKQKGNAFLNLSRYNDALMCYEKAIEIDPEYAYAWNNRGVALHKLCRYDEALSSYDKAIEIDSTMVIAWDNRGTALEALGRHEEAKESFKRANDLKHSGYKEE